MEKKRFQILCLDGGGIKGLFSAAFLAKLEEDLKINIIDHFDLIVGTSTGGIIALGLGLGLSPRKLVEFYFNEGPKIFKKIPIFTFMKHILVNKYSSSRLESIFRKDCCFGEKVLGSSNKRLVIPSYDIDSGDVYIFKTAHHKRFKRDYMIPAWKVARSTSAAPSFFSVSRSIDNIGLIDGGVWANNPVMVGLVEAMSILEIPLDSLRILSIGTTEVLKRHSKYLDTLGGLLLWAKSTLELIMQAQSISVTSQASLLLKDRFERVSPKVPKNLFELDKLNVNELFAFAAKHSRNFSPIFEQKFKDHIANTFIPEYKLKEGVK